MANISQSHFRFGKDDGTESSHTFWQLEDIDHTQEITANWTFLLRFCEQVTTAVSNVDAQFQYNKNEAGWVNITTSSVVVKAVAVAAFGNGDACTKRLSGTGTFETSGAGCTEDGLSGGNANDIVLNGNSETEAGLQVVFAQVVNGDIIQFRLTSPDGTMVYDITPALHIVIASLTAVGDELQVVWHVRQAVPDTAQFIYHVRTTLSDTSQSIWNVLTSVGDTNQFIWHVRGLVAQTREAIWHVRYALADTVEAVWNVRTSVADELQAIWNVLTALAVGDTIEFVWHVRYALGKTNEYVYHVRSVVGDTAQAIWHDLTTVTDNLTASWNLRYVVTQTRQAIWNVLANVLSVYKSIQFIWDIRIRRLSILASSSEHQYDMTASEGETQTITSSIAKQLELTPSESGGA